MQTWPDLDHQLVNERTATSSLTSRQVESSCANHLLEPRRNSRSAAPVRARGWTFEESPIRSTPVWRSKKEATRNRLTWRFVRAFRTIRLTEGKRDSNSTHYQARAPIDLFLNLMRSIESYEGAHSTRGTLVHRGVVDNSGLSLSLAIASTPWTCD